jgi:4-alpha-glucanotransferase
VDPSGAPDLGVFLPLYGLVTDTGTDLGDLADLARLTEGLAEQSPGPLAIALLPLLATRPDSPSPYSPVSRRFWNELHLDLTALPGGSDALADAGRAARIAARRADRHVDWAAVATDVHEVLDAVAAALGDRLDAETAGDDLLHRYARFRAGGDRCAERRHLAGQWAMRRQMAELTAALATRDQTLVLDLPVGAAADGFDVADDPEQFLEGWSVGAPPDPLFSGGQSWGLPPPLPAAGSADGHRLFAESLATLARHAGVVRVDHVMALQRLWWIPPGAPATDGVYVAYPTDELVAAMSVESHRHGAVIVGEDLGTVSRSVRNRMRRAGMLGMHEEQFAIDAMVDAVADGGLDDVPAEVVAGLNTHDMPTFGGFCHGSDVHDHAALGLHDAAGAEAALARRDAALAAYAAHLGTEPEARALLVAALRRLGGSPARIVSVALEDLWLEAEPQNVPGTSTERPNWTRRMAVPAGSVPTHPDVVAGLALLREARRRARCGQPAPSSPTGPAR